MTVFFSLIFGVLPAWFVSTTDFKLRKVYDLLLYLPLAIPTYIMAFTYSDIVSYTGPVQTFFRNYSPKFAEIINVDYLQIEFLSVLPHYRCTLTSIQHVGLLLLELGHRTSIYLKVWVYLNYLRLLKS